MREVLFRGKLDWDDGIWVEGSLIKVSDYCCILTEDDGSDYDYPYLDGLTGCIDGYATPVIPETIGQYTGFTDKNMQRIFEGDIVKCSHCGEIRSVIFDRVMGSFEFDPKDPVDNPDGSCLCCDHDIFEVIGNIHDNPEMLKGE